MKKNHNKRQHLEREQNKKIQEKKKFLKTIILVIMYISV